MKSKPIKATGISAKQLRAILKEQAVAAGYIVVKDYDKRYSKDPSGQKKRTWIEVPTQVPEVDLRATLRSHVNQVVNDIMGKAHPGLGVSVPGIMRLVLNIPECKQHYESDMQQLEDDVCDVAELLGFHIVEYLDELFLVGGVDAGISTRQREERIAPLLSDTEWQVVREFFAAGSLKIATTCCHAPCEPVSVKGGYRYFKAQGCSHFTDTTDTLAIETAILKGVVQSGWTSRCNVVGGGTQAWTANVVATAPDSSKRVAFIIVPNEPNVSSLGEYVVRSSRMAEGGIAAIFLFPSIPNDGLWKLVHEGKLITAVKFAPGTTLVSGLDATLFTEIALKKDPVVRAGRIRAFHIKTWARPARLDGTETFVWAKGTEYGSPLSKGSSSSGSRSRIWGS